MMARAYRDEEENLLGHKKVDVHCNGGIHTQRTLESFPNSGTQISTELIRAMALVKTAVCSANLEVGYR